MLDRLLRLFRPAPARYETRHFRRREGFRPDYAIVARSLLRHLEFESIFDVGCANGFLLAEFRAAGKTVRGIEVSPAVREILPQDLQKQVEVGDFAVARGRYDLACCVEVAEHIPPERSSELVGALARLAERAIYFTAAPPGQGGHGHINCRPHEQWLGWFAESGWVLDRERTALLRTDLLSLKLAPWLRANSMLLQPA